LPSYTDATLDHFHNPRNARRLDDPDAVGKAGDPSKGGPFMVLYLKFAGERVAEATFQTYGCCAAIAAGSVLTEKLVGTIRSDASRWDEKAINEALGGLPMEKRHCSALAATALADALARQSAAPEKKTESRACS
jgi:NifU-like protein involved in Fe-S cluster formation